MVYPACKLADWLQTDGPDFTIDSESVNQSSNVTIVRIDDVLEIAALSDLGRDVALTSRHTFRLAVEDFLARFGGELSMHAPVLNGRSDMAWIT